MESIGQHEHEHGHGRSTTHDDPPDDAVNDAAVHDDAAAAAHDPAAYDEASTRPVTGHVGDVGAIPRAHGKNDEA